MIRNALEFQFVEMEKAHGRASLEEQIRRV